MVRMIRKTTTIPGISDQLMVGWWKLGMNQWNIRESRKKRKNNQSFPGWQRQTNIIPMVPVSQIFQLGPNELYFELPNGCWKITAWSGEVIITASMKELSYRWLGPPSPIDHRKTWSIAITTKITISQSINQIPVLSTNLTLLVDSSVCHVTRLRNVRAAFEPRHLWPRTAQAPPIAVSAPARFEKNLAKATGVLGIEKSRVETMLFP